MSMRHETTAHDGALCTGGGGPSVTAILQSVEMVAPTAIAELELGPPTRLTGAGGLPLQAPGGTRALVLVRLHAEPLATIMTEVKEGPTGPQVDLDLVWQVLGPEVGRHLEADHLEPAGGLPLAPAADPACTRERAAVLRGAPPATVVVATRERPEHLSRCLDALARLEYPSYEVVVVDNRPATDATANLVRDRRDHFARYVREDRRGGGAAHNKGLAVAEGDIVAFTDDDVLVDSHWLTAMAAGFQQTEGAACVTGLILPAELETPAQVALEQHGNYTKGFVRKVFDLGANRPDDPLFPFTAGRLGSGANMAFLTNTLRDLGGFDPAIGVGTTGRGGEDLSAFFAVVARGHRLVYEPSALVWHHHRRDLASLRQQAYGYGVGLGAYLTSSVIHHPNMVPALLRKAPAGIAYALAPRAARPGTTMTAQERHLTWLGRRGLMVGPFAYGVSRWQTRESSRVRQGTGGDAMRTARLG